ncbi:MAG: DMT family transporter [Hydrotalea sp.]|nr:DMT family transporter [Hydrotalea sp.]
MRLLTPYRRGLLLTMLGVLFITPDSLLILMAEQPAANLLFFRNAMMVALFLPLVIIFRHSVFERATTLAHLPNRLWGAIKEFYPVLIIYPATSIFFVLGTQYNTVAGNLIILSSSPLIGALLTAFYQKKKVPFDNWLAAGGVLVGIGLVTMASLADAKLFGAVCSFGAALFLALYYNFLQGRRHQPHPLLIVLLLAGGNSFLSLPFVTWGVTDLSQYTIMFINAILTTALAFAFTSYGARFISTEETLLLFMLETLLGPLLVWWVLGQVPPHQTLAGGAVVFIVVALWGWRKLLSAKK